MCDQFSFIDFCDCSQVYLDFIASSVCGIRYIASNSSHENDLNSIANTIENSTDNLEKLFNKYQELSKKEGDNNG